MFFLKIKFSLAVIRFLSESDTSTPFMLGREKLGCVEHTFGTVVHLFSLAFAPMVYESLLSMLIATLKTACTDSSASVDFAFSMLSTELYASNFISAIAVFLRT